MDFFDECYLFQEFKEPVKDHFSALLKRKVLEHYD